MNRRWLLLPILWLLIALSLMLGIISYGFERLSDGVGWFFDYGIERADRLKEWIEEG